MSTPLSYRTSGVTGCPCSYLATKGLTRASGIFLFVSASPASLIPTSSIQLGVQWLLSMPAVVLTCPRCLHQF